MIKPISPKFALSVYLRAEASAKVVQCFAETGEFEKIVMYSQKVGFTPDYVHILRMILHSNPDKSVDYAKSLVAQDPPLADVGQIVDAFEQMNMVQQFPPTNRQRQILYINIFRSGCINCINMKTTLLARDHKGTILGILSTFG